MSRIERALEKATQLRNVNTTNSKEPNNIIASNLLVDNTNRSFPALTERLEITNPLMVVTTDPESHISEEYQKLKSSLVALTQRDDQLKNVLMITSAVPGEGKSVTALNLALCLAKEIDNTVLLIDADLRKPSIDRYLGYTANLGLTDILEGRAAVEEALMHTGIGKLVVLSAGRTASNPVELFSSNRMVQFIQEVKHRYPDRYIIIDTPPVLPFAEARTLARLVDGVVFVVKERFSTGASVSEALSALEGACVLGLVYNEVELSSSDERYGHYYDSYRYNSHASSD